MKTAAYSSAPSLQFQSFPKFIEWTFRFVGVFSILFFFAVIGVNWFLGDARHWAIGGNKDGDLVQHYAAAVLWKQNQAPKIYQNYQLGDWINHWEKNEKSRLERFNYVYSPLMAWLASLFVSLPFTDWLKGWFILSVLFFSASLWLIFKFLFSNISKLPFSLVLVAIGFPSLYYTLIPEQNTTLTLLILCVAAFLANQKKEWLAGFALSCAFYKPQFMPYLAFFIFLCGNWRISLGILAGSATWLLAGILICGWEAHRLWFQSLSQMMHGNQFVVQGLIQSWSGFFSSLSPHASREQVVVAAHLLALAFALVAGNFIRFAPKKIKWEPSYTIFLAFTYYLLSSTYVGHYEILLGLPWWLIYISYGEWTPIKIFFVALFWLISFLSIAGLITGVSLTAPFLTLWFLGSLATMIDWQEIRLFFKYPSWRLPI